LRRLSDTLAHLASLRSHAKQTPPRPAKPSRLSRFAFAGTNPGALRAWSFVPPSLPAGGALVVVLHGCTQTAPGYDAGSGWSRLAEANGFALLFPEQVKANNPNTCFNWFEPADIAREGGEAQSIRQMIQAMVETHRIDPARIFVTGLSAGGAMAAVMLAAYPEVFVGGAVIAGLPYGVAQGVPQALERMRGQGLEGGPALARRARAASVNQGPWPRLQVWHGATDAVVLPANGEALVAQWRALAGIADAPDRQEAIGPHLRRVWTDGGGLPFIEHYAVAGMGHGTPLAAGGPEGLGSAGPYMLDVDERPTSSM
jgi:poly(hydroxyalkanoate) depolymerase family esterase